MSFQLQPLLNKANAYTRILVPERVEASALTLLCATGFSALYLPEFQEQVLRALYVIVLAGSIIYYFRYKISWELVASLYYIGMNALLAWAFTWNFIMSGLDPNLVLVAVHIVVASTLLIFLLKHRGEVTAHEEVPESDRSVQMNWSVVIIIFFIVALTYGMFYGGEWSSPFWAVPLSVSLLIWQAVERTIALMKESVISLTNSV